jgi:hypothetical protein
MGWLPAARRSDVGLQTGHWFILQAYVLVTGSKPGQWDCTSPPPQPGPDRDGSHPGRLGQSTHSRGVTATAFVDLLP